MGTSDLETPPAPVNDLPLPAEAQPIEDPENTAELYRVVNEDLEIQENAAQLAHEEEDDEPQTVALMDVRQTPWGRSRGRGEPLSIHRSQCASISTSS